MRQQPKFGPRFGQSGPRLQIEPQFGRVGTLFRFKATHFDPGKQIKITIIAPNRQVIYDDYLVTDDSGNIGFGKLEKRTTPHWLPGRYTFVVIGEAEHKKVTVQEFFELSL